MKVQHAVFLLRAMCPVCLCVSVRPRMMFHMTFSAMRLRDEADVHAVNPRGRGVLHLACTENDLAIAETFIEGMADVNAQDAAGLHAAHVGCRPQRHCNCQDDAGLRGFVCCTVLLCENRETH